MPSVFGAHVGGGEAPELLHIIVSLSAPALLNALTETNDHHSAIGRFVFEVGHHVDILKLLGHADRLFEVDAHTKHVTCIAATLKRHHFLSTIGSDAEHLVGCGAGVEGYASVTLKFSCAEGALLPLVIYADGFVVFGIKCNCCLRLCGESEKHQRSRK